MTGIRLAKLYYTVDLCMHMLCIHLRSFFFLSLSPSIPYHYASVVSQQSRLIVLNSVLYEEGHVPDKHVDYKEHGDTL